MRKYFSIGNRNFYFSFTPGLVLSSEKHLATHVYGYGGGGSVNTDITTGRVSGTTNSVRISSNVETQREWWIKLDNGLEKAFKLKNIDIPCREGQRIAIIGIGGVGFEHLYSVFNFASMTMHSLMSDSDMMEKCGIRNASNSSSGLVGALFVMGAIVGGAIGAFSSQIFLGILGGGVVGAIASVFVGKKSGPTEKSAQDVFKDNIAEALDWAATNLGSPRVSNSSYLTPESEWVAIESMDRSAIVKRNRELGICTVCSGPLPSAGEQAVGYCNKCKVA